MIFPKNRFVRPSRRLATLVAAASLTVGLTVTGLAGAPAASAATGAGTSVLAAPGTLRAGKQLVSANGNFRLVMARTGRIELLTRWGRLLWSPRTGTHHNARLRLLAGGKLELVSAGGARLWATRTAGKHARLVLGNNGLLRLLSGKRVLWHAGRAIGYGTHDNPAPVARLAAGASLTAGHALASYKGGYRASMSSSGAFTVTGPGGKLLWSTNSSGWAGARLTLSRGGNLDLISASGAILWSSHTSGGALLVLGDTGNLALYNARGSVIWQSARAARPTFAPAQSTSHYIRDVSDDFTSMGCTDAKANGSRSSAIVLHTGSQRTDVSGGWGVWLSAVNTPVTDADLVSYVEQYIAGYGGCMAASGKLLLAVTTNNDSRQYYTSPQACPLPPTGSPDPLGAEGGADWANNVIDPLTAYVANWPGIAVAGGDDIEPAFSGCPTQAQAWVQSFLADSGSAKYVFIGSADGCPTKPGSTADCLAGWTQQQIHQLAYGTDSSRSVPLPQIYTSGMAAQWSNVSRSGTSPIEFGGALTEVAACASAGDCTSLAGTTAWNALANALTTSSARKSAGPYVTDLRVD